MQNMQKEKRPCVVLTGPTAVGKTELSLSLARAIGAEIISADSMQVYRGMDIGTAKIFPEEMQGIPHHLIDILEPWEEFNVYRFQQMAGEAMQGIYERGHIPLIVGGTGFYIQSVLYQVDFEPFEDDGVRERLEEEAKEDGGKRRLYQRLCEADPEYAKEVHENNVKRVIRALAFYEQTGRRLSEHNRKERMKLSPYRFAYFVLTMERERLYQRINGRVDQMLKQGLLEEAKGLYDQGCREGLTSMAGLGYKEFFPYFRGEAPLSEAAERLKRDTRHFAKRQLTWFLRERDVDWINKDAFGSDEEILGRMLDILRERGIK